MIVTNVEISGYTKVKISPEPSDKIESVGKANKWCIYRVNISERCPIIDIDLGKGRYVRIKLDANKTNIST